MAIVSVGMTARPAPRVATASAALTRGVADLLPLSDAADVYRLIAPDAVADNVFTHPAFLPGAAEALGAHVEILACIVPGGRPVAATPVVCARLGHLAPALSVWTHDYGPYGAPLVCAATPGAIRGLLDGALEAAGNGSAIVFPYLPASGAIAAGLREGAAARGRETIVLDHHERAMLDRRIDGTDPRRALPTRRRKEYGRQMRRLHETAAVSVNVTASADEARWRFEEFLELEAAGWKGKRGTAMRDQPRIAQFAREAVAGLAADGACKVLTLRAGDRAVAMLIVLIAGRTATTWKIAYDEEFARFSPGAQLMLEAPPLLFADPAIERIDSCATPNHPMIDHLWHGRLALETLVIAPARGRTRFRAGLALHHAEHAAKAFARGLLRRSRAAGKPDDAAAEPARGAA